MWVVKIWRILKEIVHKLGYSFLQQHSNACWQQKRDFNIGLSNLVPFAIAFSLEPFLGTANCVLGANWLSSRPLRSLNTKTFWKTPLLSYLRYLFMHKTGMIGKRRVSAFQPCAAPYTSTFHFIFSSLEQFKDHVLRKKNDCSCV